MGSKFGGAFPIWVEPAVTYVWRPAEGAAPVTLAGGANTLVATGRGESARLRAQQVVIRHLRPVALDFEIQVVLQRQRDGILQRKVQVAAAQ